MNIRRDQIKTGLFVALCIAGMLVCIIDIIGGLFYLADNSAWFFVPPVVALVSLYAASRPRTIAASLTLYSLAALFIVSYAVDNWRWALERIQIGGFYMAPDIAAVTLIVIALWQFHRQAPARDASPAR